MVKTLAVSLSGQVGTVFIGFLELSYRHRYIRYQSLHGFHYVPFLQGLVFGRQQQRDFKASFDDRGVPSLKSGQKVPQHGAHLQGEGVRQVIQTASHPSVEVAKIEP